jgi:hypothetical protein
LAGIDTCEVLEDDGETVLREVKFKMVFLYPPTSPQYCHIQAAELAKHLS